MAYPLNRLFNALAIAASVSRLGLSMLAAAESSDQAKSFDLQAFIDREVKAGNHLITVPPGRYRISPKNREHLALRGLMDLTIIADGVEMVCTETTRALTIDHCTNVILRGLTIDYDPLPFTQGRITGFSADRKTCEIELFAGYPPAEMARNFKYEVFRPDTRTLRCEDRRVENLEAVDVRHLRLGIPAGHGGDAERVGDLIVIGAEYAPHGSAAHAIECSHNINVRLESIDLFASNCFGFLEYDCDGSTYYRCRIDRRPTSNDPVLRADPRLRSLNADAFHSKRAIKGPVYLECSARFMGDDCVNICGDYHLIMNSRGRELRVLAKHDMNILAGDPVELVTYDGRRLADARAVAIQPAGTIREEERVFLARQRMDASLKAARGALTTAFAVTLDREVEISMGGVICSANRIGNGFAVKNCNFGFNRSRGILIKASNGQISGNRIQGTEMSAILIAPEYWWLEAGSSIDLQISDNTIIASGGIPICVEAVAGNGDIAPAGLHRNLSIVGNKVQDCLAPGILVCATRGLHLENNLLELNGPRKFLPAVMRQTGMKELLPVVEIHCERAEK